MKSRSVRSALRAIVVASALAAAPHLRAAAGPVPELTVTLCTETTYDNERTPVNPGDDFLSFPPALYAVVVAASGAELNLAARVVAEQAEGLAAGTVLVAPTDVVVAELHVDAPRGVIGCNLPAGGFPPGCYRFEVVDREEPTRVLARTTFTTHHPPLPAASAVTLELGTAVDGSQTITDPGTEFGSQPASLFVRTTVPGDASLRYRLRVLAQDVPGLARDRVILSTAPEFDRTLDASAPSDLQEFKVPRLGLPPGRYRVELGERDRPRRVVATKTFTTRALSAEAGPFNLADAELGGTLERVSGEEGVGLTWAPLLLTRGNSRAWTPPGPPEAPEIPALPAELTLSFFQREPELVSAVEITAESSALAPREIEVWGSMESATAGFTRIARATMDEAVEGPWTIAVPPTFVRFLKLRLLAAREDGGPSLLAVRVLEGRRDGYTSLLGRHPEIADWRWQPRHAAQSGMFFLQPEAVRWQRANTCLGCHVQSQAVMGIAVARANDYVVSEAVERLLTEFTRERQGEDGDFARRADEPAAKDGTMGLFAALTLAYASRTPERDAALVKAARWLATRQIEDGSVPGDDSRAPIEQGELMQTGNVIEVWTAQLARQDDATVRTARQRALEFVANAEPHTTQDQVFQILTLARHGDDAQKRRARQLALGLARAQQPDGGWLIEPEDPAGLPSPFATGEALYALRVAGVSTGTAAFRRGVEFLLARQAADGSWGDPALTSNFAATMWPTIALAGSFATRGAPARLTVIALPRPPRVAPTPEKPAAVVVQPAAPALPKNLEFVLDCSLSMIDHLGKRTRLETAKQVMRDVIAKLPDDANVGLRLYGHRHDSMSAPSRTDTQLVVPIQPLDRAALRRVIDGATAHGQTPLVYSTLQAAEDLKKVGGGTIIVVTDGEESCGGKPRKAGSQLAALGVPLRLNVIGFTITGKRVVDELTAFVGPTGGRFYTANDGSQLAQALNDAIAPKAEPPPIAVTAATAEPPPPPEPEDLPFEVFNAAGDRVAASSTLGAELPELEPGPYRVVLRDGAKTATLERVDLKTGEAVELSYDPGAGTLRIARE